MDRVSARATAALIETDEQRLSRLRRECGGPGRADIPNSPREHRAVGLRRAREILTELRLRAERRTGAPRTTAEEILDEAITRIEDEYLALER